MTKSVIDAYKTMLFEMAYPSEDIKNMTFYHGTSKEDNAKGIMQDGVINPSEVVSKASLTPVKGAAYITKNIGYAQIYALGGDMAGYDYPEKYHQGSRHGYVFKVQGKDLTDVQPDEDSIGEMVGNKQGPSWLHHLANKHVADSTLRQANSREYSAYARIGKNLVKKMSDSQKLDLIVNHNAHVAHIGKLVPSEVYKIDKTKAPLLKNDGSNFFDHAEKVK